ncbi:MAG: RnfABCDGE type electron transport complex subunit D [Acholeplasmataceae bacterium]|nr:RnfABCDGE type electron transport complex subunit D [Acholeplasmataceae bacterium]
MTQSGQTLHADALTQKNLLIFTGFLGILLIAATVIFGWYVLAIAAVSYAVSITIELIFAKIRKKKLDMSWMVTPLVFALLMPPTAPLWMVAIGSGFGIFFGKSIFGGLGKTVFNPALVGVLFVQISFPAFMATMWLDPVTDIVSAVTPLISLGRGLPFDYSFTDLLFGMIPGTLGETFRLGIIVLGLGLIALKIADWRIPLFFIGSVFLLTWIGHLFDPTTFKDPLLSIFTGGIMFGAFFVATDPVTAPSKSIGKMIYGFGLGFLTVLIRNFAAFPEGVTFSVIIMNAISPLIDNWNNKEITPVEPVEVMA